MITAICCEQDCRFPRIARVIAARRRREGGKLVLLDLTTMRATGGAVPPASPADGAAGSGGRRPMETELDRLLARHEDIVIDTDDLFSRSGIAALTAARTALLALRPRAAPRGQARDALIARIERAWLFNPRLEAIVLPLCMEQEPSSAVADLVVGLAGPLPCVRMSSVVIRNPADLRPFTDGSLGPELRAICDDLATTKY